jgi:hypothetical protein
MSSGCIRRQARGKGEGRRRINLVGNSPRMSVESENKVKINLERINNAKT